MENLRIVGICGKARSGKDTFAELLAESLFNSTGSKFVLMAYANMLKLRIQKDFNLSYEQLWGSDKEVEDRRYLKSADRYWTPREIMQEYGQFYRSIDDKFWIKYLFNTIEDKGYSNVIITDIRHPNEADPVVNIGGRIIKVVSSRDNMTGITNESHISEIAMDTYDKVSLVVDNSTTIANLRRVASEISENLFQ